MTPAQILSDIQAIEARLRSGVVTTRDADGNMVTYDPVQDRERLADLKREYAASAGSSQFRRVKLADNG